MMRILETNRVVAPFGLQLRSEASGAAVAQNIALRIADPSERYGPVTAAANASRVFVAHRLPGVSTADLLADDWSSLARTRRIEVLDSSGQYLPFTATVRLPSRGLLTLAAVEPASPPLPGDGAFPVFPAPAFVGAPPLAEVRVELSHPDGTPAAWALVIVEIAGRDYRGLTDERGVGLVAFPWPQPPRSTLPGSPPEIAEYRWDVSVSAHSTRLAEGSPPDLAALLAQRLGPRLELQWQGSPPPTLPAPLILVFPRPLNLPPATLVSA
jgi:hypothetical protein